MFEMQSKRSGRSQGQRKHSTSNNHLQLKDPLKLLPSSEKRSAKIQPQQKIVVEAGKMEEQKSKSQCFSKDKPIERKSIDVSKFVNTTRSTGFRKSKQKSEKTKSRKGDRPLPTQEAALTENNHQQPYLIANLTTEKSSELKWNKKGSLKKSEGRSVERKKAQWNEKKLPLDWEYAVERYGHLLTRHERSEIREYKKVYYLGHRAAKRQRIDLAEAQSTHFDNEDKEYRFVEYDHIAYRYELLAVIGKGSYGQVFRVLDHKTNEEGALKVIKNEPKFSKQAFIEIKILSHVKERDRQGQANVVKIRDFMVFRKHVCILFQLLSDNLYELIIRNNYSGLSEELVRRFAIQLLVSLQFLRSEGIVHCDLKPENILLKEYNKSGIKMIDFGSSCFEQETLYTYIQSRYYRAPEITLGLPYSHQIDIWSAGCILAELTTGVPLFPGENQMEQMHYMTNTLGLPPMNILSHATRRYVFFDDLGKPKPELQCIPTAIELFTKPLSQRIQDPDFVAFIESFLKWQPEHRIKPVDAINHPWISKGLPEELRKKLIATTHPLSKSQTFKQSASSKRVKTNSKEKGGSLIKLTRKSSQQKTSYRHGLKP